MGTWEIGAFDNDSAADFSGRLDDCAPGERESLVRGALEHAISATDFLDSDEGCEAVAAAALVEAHHTGVPANSVYGPKQPVPLPSPDLPALAVRALDAIVGESSELMELWGDDGPDNSWLREIRRLRDALEGLAG
ncbi:DUF4259 domain-containing protein [Streptomyces sp. SM12]|uniref:DUF4259 domain-containing protein n=1 Tax=Streptomyces sp. SM12 TaxID=1071602 RepID=UPI000CD599EE|nr:DUF4259 domain-containing protein [Streptomyces sp. SM12]